MHRPVLRPLPLALLAAVLAACGGGATTATTTTAPATTRAATSAPTTAAATTTTRTTTTGGTTATGAGPEEIEMPGAIGAYSLIDIGADVGDLVGDLPFEGAGAALYGRGDQPEYLVLIASDPELAAVDPEEVVAQLAAGFSESVEIDPGSTVTETEGAATINCFSGTSEGQPFAVCAVQEEAALGVVLSIPGVGPSDIPSALDLTRDLIEVPG